MTYIIYTDNLSDEFFKRVKSCEDEILPQRLHQSSKNHSLLGRVLLGYILEKDYGITEFSLRYGENGKPYLKEWDIFFNISHSGKYVVCSADEREIGCDIQCVGKYNERIPERFFTKEENDYLKVSENKEWDFTRLWSLKESILKKTGDGITAGLSAFTFEDSLQENHFKKFGCFFNVYTIEDAVLSVCSGNEDYGLTEVKKEEIETYMNSVLKGV